MNLTSELTALKSRSRDLTLAERAKLSCQLAKQLEKAGQYEGRLVVPDDFKEPLDEMREYME